MLAGDGGIIVVMPDARNRYFGSFYTNSPTTGRWEDFVSTDLVPYIDQKYRITLGLKAAALRATRWADTGPSELG